MSATISRFKVPELAELAEDVRERILAVQEKAGFVPNVFLMLAHRPAEFRAFFDYHDALMEKDVGLSKAEREMIVVATSAAGQCLYCVIAHGAILRIRAKNPRVADQVALNHRRAEITPRLVLRLLNDVGDDPDQLPLLQHLLMRLWEHAERQADQHHAEP